MMGETDPVGDDEYVFRRVLAQDVNESNAESPVARTGFRPNAQDVNGISVYREAFVTSNEIDEAGRKPGEYYIFRLNVRELREVIGVDVIPDPMPPLPGHCLIPEVRHGLKGREKLLCKEVQRKLAVLADHHFALKPAANR
jgi:hypothetical protein